ncbi:MAG: transposase [Chloroflexi bacterium]|nr:transposase [Chloroflexota bacterium]
MGIKHGSIPPRKPPTQGREGAEHTPQVPPTSCRTFPPLHHIHITTMSRPYNPEIHHRRSIRLPNWDYRSPGYYFVTICTADRHCLFDTPHYHEVATHTLQNIPNQKHAQHITLDEWVVMPNHIHAIFIFTDYPPQADIKTQQHFGNALAGSLGVIVGRYKAFVTMRINHLRRTKGQSIWQRGYYERIMANEQEWRATQKYIIENPIRWAEDRDNLDALLAKMTYHNH